MAQHTKGPWIAYSDGIGDKVTIEVQTPGLRSIIATCYRGSLCEEHGGSHEGNAALISAALVMLEALRGCVDYIQQVEDDGQANSLIKLPDSGTLLYAKEALRLAEGR